MFLYTEVKGVWKECYSVTYPYIPSFLYPVDDTQRNFINN